MKHVILTLSLILIGSSFAQERAMYDDPNLRALKNASAKINVHSSVERCDSEDIEIVSAEGNEVNIRLDGEEQTYTGNLIWWGSVSVNTKKITVKGCSVRISRDVQTIYKDLDLTVKNDNLPGFPIVDHETVSYKAEILDGDEVVCSDSTEPIIKK